MAGASERKDNRLFANMPLQALDVGNLEVLRDRKKDVPFAADERLKVLRQVFETKRDGKPVVPNIARLVVNRLTFTPMATRRLPRTNWPAISNTTE